MLMFLFTSDIYRASNTSLLRAECFCQTEGSGSEFFCGVLFCGIQFLRIGDSQQKTNVSLTPPFVLNKKKTTSYWNLWERFSMLFVLSGNSVLSREVLDRHFVVICTDKEVKVSCGGVGLFCIQKCSATVVVGMVISIITH